MFVAKSERGRGLGDVLLFETLNRRCKTFPRSHLYVSSRNTTAVAIYNKFGFVQSDKPSGDVSHDLVRFCRECHISEDFAIECLSGSNPGVMPLCRYLRCETPECA